MSQVRQGLPRTDTDVQVMANRETIPAGCYRLPNSIIVRHFIQSSDEILTCNSVQDYNVMHSTPEAGIINDARFASTQFMPPSETPCGPDLIVGWLVITAIFAEEAALRCP